MDEIAKIEASLAEAKQKAEEAGGNDESLNQAVKDAEEALTKAKAPSQDPVKKELDRVKGKKEFTRRERLNFEKKKIDEQLRDLDKEEGIDPQPDEDDAKPLTIGDWKKLERDRAKSTALDLAEAIEDEAERELCKEYLKTRIVPSGNPESDLKFARAAVNALKNAQIAEEAARGGRPKSNPSAPGAPAKHEKEFEPTPEEQQYMRPPFNMTKEEILKVRAKKA